jgi:hypothetical protein
VTPEVKRLTQSLPYALRESVEGYTQAVQEVLPEIAKEAEVQLTDSLRNQFLFVVAVRRVWEFVSGSCWIAESCIDIAQRHGIAGFQVGGDLYAKGSETYESMDRLRKEFSQLIERLKIGQFVRASSLRSALVQLSMS